MVGGGDPTLPFLNVEWRTPYLPGLALNLPLGKYLAVARGIG